MNISLKERTADTVRIYFERANTPEIRATLPQKAQTLDQALSDYEKTLLPDANSFGQTIYADGKYIGDVWCYGIDLAEQPNCMISYCIFDPDYWSKGIATAAVGMFIRHIRRRYNIKTIGAFAFSHHTASIRVLQKNGFSIVEEFRENGIESKFFLLDF